MLTQAQLKEILHYDADSGIFTWKIPTSNRVKALQAAGCIRKDGYIFIGIKGKMYSAHRLAWMYMYGCWPVNDVDHINGCRTDNKMCNLREATRSENLQNQRRPRSNNKSGFLGVSLQLKSKKYRADIRIDGKNKRLGVFDTVEQAYSAYIAAKRTLHGYCTI